MADLVKAGPAGLLPNPLGKLTADTLGVLPFHRRQQQGKTVTARRLFDRAKSDVGSAERLASLAATRNVSITQSGQGFVNHLILR